MERWCWGLNQEKGGGESVGLHHAIWIRTNG
jgi:hypothetical protein